MKYLFDSDAVNILYDDQRKPYHEHLHARIATLKDEDSIQTSVLVLCELEYSFFNAPHKKKQRIRETIESIVRDFDRILPVEPQIASIYGELKSRLKHERHLTRKAMRVHNIDIILASTAISTSSVLIGMDKIYHDIADFYPDFQCENWLLPQT